MKPGTLVEVFTWGSYSLETYLSYSPHSSVEITQVHGPVWKNARDVMKSVERTKADGLFYIFHGSNQWNHDPSLGIKTADCLCLAIWGTKGMALLHAGWRGLEANILEDPSFESLNPYHLHVASHICKDCYEVGDEFREKFPASCFQGRNLDMVRFVKESLEKKYPKMTLSSSPLCTYHHSVLYSFRRDQTKYRNYHLLRRIA